MNRENAEEILTLLSLSCATRELNIRDTSGNKICPEDVAMALAGLPEICDVVVYWKYADRGSVDLRRVLVILAGSREVHKDRRRLPDFYGGLVDMAMEDYIVPIVCPTCRGVGVHEYTQTICPDCDGAGKRKDRESDKLKGSSRRIYEEIYNDIFYAEDRAIGRIKWKFA